MRYSNIFQEIVSITQTDYAGYDEKRGWDNPDWYLNEIERLESQETMTPQLFMDMVNDYLVDFQDSHMYFLLSETDVKAYTPGFKVRRCENGLYVTETGKETRLEKGAQILSIDGIGIEEMSRSKQRMLWEPHPEREDWSNILKQASLIDVKHNNGRQEMLKLNFSEVGDIEPIYEMESIDEDTLLLTMSDFSNVDVITKLIKANENRLQEKRNLIIDVRHNGGGNANAYSSLMPYLFNKGENPTSVTEHRDFNCTNRNVDLFKRLVEQMGKIADDQATIDMIHDLISQFEEARGQGFVTIDFSDYISDLENDFESREMAPEHIIVLSDCHCASAGDAFVEECKASSKVTVIGRATKGVMDYSDLVMERWEDMYSLYYPISKVSEKTEAHLLHGKGVKPDNYIPWTPRHLEEDVDLKQALELIHGK